MLRVADVDVPVVVVVTRGVRVESVVDCGCNAVCIPLGAFRVNTGAGDVVVVAVTRAVECM